MHAPLYLNFLMELNERLLTITDKFGRAFSTNLEQARSVYTRVTFSVSNQSKNMIQASKNVSAGIDNFLKK